MRKLYYNASTQLHIYTITFEFVATDSDSGEIIEVLTDYYTVTAETRAEEICLALLHLISDVVASKELSMKEKMSAINAINLEYTRLVSILTSKLYKITYTDVEKYPINQSIVVASNFNYALHAAHAGRFLNTDFYTISCEQITDDCICSVEKVSFFDACNILCDNE